MCAPIIVAAAVMGTAMIASSAIAASNKPKMPDMPKAPDKMPDVTDQAVKARAMQDNVTNLFGSSRKASMLTGPLGDKSSIPTVQKSILGS